MKKIIQITRPKDVELVQQIEALHYEAEGRSRVISDMLGNGCNIDTDAFQAYQKEFTRTVSEYGRAKDAFISRYPEVRGTWRLDWNRMELSYDETEQ